MITHLLLSCLLFLKKVCLLSLTSTKKNAGSWWNRRWYFKTCSHRRTESPAQASGIKMLSLVADQLRVDLPFAAVQVQHVDT